MTDDTEATWLEFLRAAAREADNREIGRVDRSTRIDALELDSVAFMSVVAYFEDKLDQRLPQQRFHRVKTVGDFFDAIERELGSAG